MCDLWLKLPWKGVTAGFKEEERWGIADVVVVFAVVVAMVGGMGE